MSQKAENVARVTASIRRNYKNGGCHTLSNGDTGSTEDNLITTKEIVKQSTQQPRDGASSDKVVRTHTLGCDW